MLDYRLVTLGGLSLLDQDGQAVTSLGPRNLALLAYLALATKPLSRDHVAELLWGDRDEDRARHSMREALSKLRQLLGPDSIARRSDRVALASSVPLSVDARALAAAARVGDTRRVVDLYGGPFLDGVYLGGARSFEEWADAERSTYEARFVSACAPECARLRQVGAWTECAELARRWLTAAPLDPAAAVELLQALAAPGSRDAKRLAIREYRHIAERLVTDFDAAPHPSVVSAADEIARGAAQLPAQPSPDLRLTAPVDAPLESLPGTAPADDADTANVGGSSRDGADSLVESPASQKTSVRRRRLARMAMSLFTIALVAAAIVLMAHARAIEAGAVGNGAVAIVPFEVMGNASEKWLATGAPRLLGASLAEEHVVSVFDPSQVREALSSNDTTASPSLVRAQAAARSLGARWILSGSVIAGGGRYWLDLWLTDVRVGGAARRVTITDTTLDAVVTEATARLAANFDAPREGAQLVEFAPNTVAAYRAYIRAVQLRAQMRNVEAAAALDAAIAADSGFVTAVMERRYMLGAPATAAMVDTARALESAYARGRARATEFERLDFDSYLALHAGNHDRADSYGRMLVARYPRDPRAYNSAFEILAIHGRFADAADIAQRAIALDSVGRTLGADECRVCIGYRSMSEIARITGDLPRAEMMARRAVSVSPEDPSGWAQLGTVLSARGRYDEAIAAAKRAGVLAPTDPDFALDAIRRLIEARRYEAADSALRIWKSTTDARFALSATDMRLLLLRERGQFRAAAALLDAALRRFPADSNWLVLVQGETLARIGDMSGARHALKAAVSAWPEGHGANPGSNYPADRARTNTWPRAVLADALWQAGQIDTVSLALLADSIQSMGAQSYYGRDWRLYHHIRGLLAMSGGHWARAEYELGRARWEHAPWTRTLVERSNAQLAQGHNVDAIASLRDAYTSPLAAVGRYVPRSELDFQMARAFAAAGAVDSARVYARYAADAWRAADPAVVRRLTQLPASVTGQVSQAP